MPARRPLAGDAAVSGATVVDEVLEAGVPRIESPDEAVRAAYRRALGGHVPGVVGGDVVAEFPHLPSEGIVGGQPTMSPAYWLRYRSVARAGCQGGPAWSASRYRPRGYVTSSK